jgi:hypothetical protein
MKPELLAAILAYYRADATLQALLVGTSTLDVKVAYALLPPVYPSVTFHLDREDSDPRAGYCENKVADMDDQLAIHIWTKNDGQIIGTGLNAVNYDAVSLQLAIADRVRVLSLNISQNATIAAIADLREVRYTSMPLQYEEDTEVHHTSGLLKFVYATMDTV